MIKHIAASLLLSFTALSIGCVAEPVDPDAEALESDEPVAEPETFTSCPQQTICYQACDSVDRVWKGLCKDDGACFCQVDHSGGGSGSGPSSICYINWTQGWGTWICYEY